MIEQLNQERRKQPKGRLMAAAAVSGSLLIAGCGAGSSANKKGLKVGESIYDTQVVDFKVIPKDQKVILKGNNHNDALGIIYTDNLSESLMASRGDTNKDHVVGLLLTEKSNKIRVGFVFFENSNHKIVHLSSTVPIKDNGRQTLFAGTNAASTLEYEVDIKPESGSGYVEVSYLNLTAGNQTPTLPPISA